MLEYTVIKLTIKSDICMAVFVEKGNMNYKNQLINKRTVIEVVNKFHYYMYIASDSDSEQSPAFAV